MLILDLLLQKHKKWWDERKDSQGHGQKEQTPAAIGVQEAHGALSKTFWMACPFVRMVNRSYRVSKHRLCQWNTS